MQPSAQLTNKPKPTYSKREASRRHIINAARDLVMELGHANVTMTVVADRANVSRATLYRYYSTREQLYSDVSIQWGMNFVDHMRQNPPQGGTVGERICMVIRETVKASADHPKLMAAHISTMIADAESLQVDQRQLKTLMPGIINSAVGKVKSDNLELAADTLQHVLISNLILLNAGKTQSSKIIQQMEKIASRLLDDIWDKP